MNYVVMHDISLPFISFMIIIDKFQLIYYEFKKETKPKKSENDQKRHKLLHNLKCYWVFSLMQMQIHINFIKYQTVSYIIQTLKPKRKRNARIVDVFFDAGIAFS